MKDAGKYVPDILFANDTVASTIFSGWDIFQFLSKKGCCPVAN